MGGFSVTELFVRFSDISLGGCSVGKRVVGYGESVSKKFSCKAWDRTPRVRPD